MSGAARATGRGVRSDILWPCRTLSTTTGEWDQSGLTFAYQWLRDGIPVTGATEAHLLLGAADVRHRMSVQVTATRAGAAPATSRSTATSPVTRAAARVRLGVADATPAAGSRTKVTVRVTATPSAVDAGGRVKVLVDGKLVRTVRVSDGTATLKIAFAAGTHKVKALYTGSPMLSRASADRRVRALR